MRRSVTMITLGFLMACGGSGDACHQVLSLAQNEVNKVDSCGGDATAEKAAIVGFEDGGLQNCEANIKNCTPADLNAVERALNCDQALLSSATCKCLTEADPVSDPTCQQYVIDAFSCVGIVSSACHIGL